VGRNVPDTGKNAPAMMPGCSQLGGQLAEAPAPVAVITLCGRRSGLATRTYAHWRRLEGGEHNPSVDTLTRLAKGLGMEFHIDVTSRRMV